MFKHKKNIFIFDFDGVLVKSLEVKSKAFAGLYQNFGVDVVKKVLEHHKTYGGISRFEKIPFYHLQFLGIKLNDQEKETLFQKYSNLVLDEIVSCDEVAGVSAFLANLPSDYWCYVNSGTPTSELRIIIERRGMAHHFRKILGSPASKVENIDQILNKDAFDVKSALFFGDSLTDYLAAKERCIDFVGIFTDGKSNILDFDPDVVWFHDFVEFSKAFFHGVE